MAIQSIEKFTDVAKDHVETLTKSSTVAFNGLQALAKAYQDVASRNFEKQVASIKTLTAVKTPAEFFEIQQKLVKDSIEASIADGRALAELTVSVFTTAFEPVQKQITGLQATFKKAA